MTKEWADSYLEYFRSLNDAPDDAIPCLLRMSLHGLVWDSIKKKDKVDTFIRYLSPLYYNYNGSFHEYDIELSYFFEGKKTRIDLTSDYIYYIDAPEGNGLVPGAMTPEEVAERDKDRL